MHLLSRSSGKSHLLSQLCLSTQLSSSPGGTIYLYTEGRANNVRLGDLAIGMYERVINDLLPPVERYQSLKERWKLMGEEMTLTELCSNVTLLEIDGLEELEDALDFLVPKKIEESLSTAQIQSSSSSNLSKIHPIRLICIDSIGALFRVSFGSKSSELAERKRKSIDLGIKLSTLAAHYHLAVVLANQVSDVMSKRPLQRSHPSSSSPSPSLGQSSSPSSSPSDSLAINLPYPHLTADSATRWTSGQNRDLPKKAMIGPVWTDNLSVRIMLSKTGEVVDEEGEVVNSEKMSELARVQELRTLRKMTCVFAPWAKEGSVKYVIEKYRVVSWDDIDRHGRI
jgi:hypothetical protein